RRMDWIVGDIIKTHGTSGMEPIVPAPGGQDGHVPLPLPTTPPGFPGGPYTPGPAYTAPVYPAPVPAPSVDGNMLPAPRSVPMPPVPEGQAPVNPPQTDLGGRNVPPAVPQQTAAPAVPRQEESQWTVKPR